MVRALWHFADVQGRASRSEYWLFVLMQYTLSIGFLVATPVAMKLGSVPWQLFGLVRSLVSISLMIAGFTVAVRRLHDTGRSGWWLLLLVLKGLAVAMVFVLALGLALSGKRLDDLANLLHDLASVTLAEWLEPKSLVLLALLLAGVVSAITLFVFMCLKGTKGTNRFGADPLAT